MSIILVQLYLLVSQQSSNEESSLALFSPPPYNIMCVTCCLAPVSQERFPAFVIQTIFPRRVTLIPLGGAQTLCFLVIKDRKPSNWDPILRFLALIVVNIQQRH